MKISKNSNLEISTKGLFLLSGTLVLIGFILLILGHTVFGVIIFLISGCVFIIHSIISAAKKEKDKKAKGIAQGSLAGCGSTLLIMILFTIGIVNSPTLSKNQLSVSDDISASLKIVETNDLAISNNSEAIIDEVESNANFVNSNENKLHDTELNTESTIIDTESKLSQNTTSKLESRSESKEEPKVESKQESKFESKIDPKLESKVQSVAPQPVMHSYVFICNTDSMCYHTHECQAAKKLLSENRFEYTVNAYSESEAMEYIESQGYWLCGICAR